MIVGCLVPSTTLDTLDYPPSVIHGNCVFSFSSSGDLPLDMTFSSSLIISNSLMIFFFNNIH